MVIFLVVLFGAVFGWDALRSHFMHQYFANFQPPPQVISAAKVKVQSWQPYYSAVGTLKAVNGVNIAPEIAGIITKIYFKSGETVQQGQRIIKLNDSVEQADLQNNQAQLTLNQVNYERTKDLYLKNASSKSSLDDAMAKLKQSKAQVAKTKAIIAKKNITAPFTGTIGIRDVNVGQYVSPGTTIVSLQAISPIYVNFYLPEQDMPNLHVGQAIKLTADTYPNESFDGKITAINAEVDVSTHNIMVQATLPNTKHKLYPGVYGNVHVMLPENLKVITVPQTAVTFTLFGNSVYVVHKDGKDKKGKPILKVKQTYVETGDQRNGLVVITKGLKPGDLVVTSGQLKLQNGSRVAINDTVKLNQVQNEIY